MLDRLKGRAALASIARSRVAQFLALGACIFTVAPRTEGAPAIEAVEERALQDELLYREALRLGLDRDDSIVRERLIQKVLFLAEDLGGATREPSDADLRAFFEATRARWTRPTAVRFVHVFAANVESLGALRSKVVAWSAGAPADAVPPFGESFPLSRAVLGRAAEIEARYGSAVAAEALRAPLGAWSQPVQSKYGFHLVRVVERRDERPATFDEARDELKLSYLIARREEATASFLDHALSRYRVSLDGKRVTTLSSSPRTAARGGPSAED
jgi:hypothetical protein